MTRTSLALHAPAGDIDSVKAAVYNGADAVYLGVTFFNARRLAKNFTFEQLKEIIFFCHVHKVKVYLTMNTLVRNDELPLWFKTLEQAYLLGINAVIIQEVFFTPFIKKYFPELRVHASTQASFMNYHGINQFKHFDSVILARELTHEQIKNIRAHTSIELEVFVHGHVCISYSGQCLISSLIGKRSGNRGICASSCRKNYNNQGYLISAKDLFLANSVDKIYNLGINAVKIEGRMKSADYVGVATRTYRKQIDALYTRTFKPLSQEALNKLKLGFNRDFTTGFFGGNVSIVGKEMPMNRGIYLGTVYHGELRLEHELEAGDGISFWHYQNKGKLTGCIVKKIFPEGRETKEISYAKKGMMVSLPTAEFINGAQVFLTAKKMLQNSEVSDSLISFPVIIQGNAGKPLIFKSDDLEVFSEIPLVNAKNRQLEKEDILKELEKSNRLGISWKIRDFIIQDNLFLPKSVLRKIREALEEKVREKFVQKRVSYFNKVPEIKTIAPEHEPRLLVKVYSLKQLEEANNTGAYAVYYDIFNNDVKQAKELCTKSKFFLDTPVILSDEDIAKIQNIINDINPEGIVIGNWGLLSVHFKGEKHGKYSLNVFNDISVAALQEKGILPMVSVELNAKQVMKFSNKQCMYYAHGRIPVMHFKGIFEQRALTDEKGYRFPLRIVNNNTEMLYSRPLAAFEKISELITSGIRYFFLDLERDTTTIITAYKHIIDGKKQDISMLKKGTTIGNYNKGVA